MSSTSSASVYWQPLKSWKYRTTRTFIFHTGLRVPETIQIPGGQLILHGNDDDIAFEGCLAILPGYAWDGCSGPTWDDATNMRAGLVHDALYQLLRADLLPPAYRRDADDLLKKMVLEDGMGPLRAAYFHWGVRTFGRSSAVVQDDAQSVEKASP